MLALELPGNFFYKLFVFEVCCSQLLTKVRRKFLSLALQGRMLFVQLQ